MSISGVLLQVQLLAQTAGAGEPLAPGRETGTTLLVQHVVSGFVFSVIGLLVFAASLYIMTRVVPFSIRKEIEEDQNTALGVIVGSVLIGISIIIAAAIQG